MFTPFFIAIILPVQYFGLAAFIVVPIHGPWSRSIENLASKVEA